MVPYFYTHSYSNHCCQLYSYKYSIHPSDANCRHTWLFTIVSSEENDLLWIWDLGVSFFGDKRLHKENNQESYPPNLAL